MINRIAFLAAIVAHTAVSSNDCISNLSPSSMVRGVTAAHHSPLSLIELGHSLYFYAFLDDGNWHIKSLGLTPHC
jgi:hypothetical protein